MAHLFICPSCGHRSSSSEREEGFSRRDKSCIKCAFPFLFELLDDYYPAPNASFFTTDGEGRMIGLGRGATELTGLTEKRCLGRPVSEVLGLKFEDGRERLEEALEWGVRVKAAPVEVNAEGDRTEQAIADIFPAYDDDGGLLIVLTPQS